MICDLGRIEVPRKPIKCRGSWVWRPPALGVLKVNTDESFLENLGQGGIRDLIRDSERRVFIQFCK